MRSSWDSYFLDIAKAVRGRATCASRQVGCVLVRDNQIIATGYNGGLPGEAHCLDVGCLGNPCLRCIHAEANAIVSCAASGVSCNGATAYVTCRPCVRCSRLLIRAGIARLVCIGEFTDEHKGLFRERGIPVLCYEEVPDGQALTEAAASVFTAGGGLLTGHLEEVHHQNLAKCRSLIMKGNAIHAAKRFAQSMSETHETYLLHVVNCAGKWGKGFVTGLSQYNTAHEASYRSFIAHGAKLGQVLYSGDDLLVVCHLFAMQDTYHSTRNPNPLNITALTNCLVNVRDQAKDHKARSGKEVALFMPALGCGLARGDWEEVRELIRRAFTVDGLHFYVALGD